MLFTWDLTVPAETKRSLAISEFVRPEAKSASTSSSRSLRSSTGGWGVSPSLAAVPAGDGAILGSSCRSCSRRAYAWMPSSTRSRRYPLLASSSSISAASSAVREVRIAAVTGVSSPRSARASSSSFSLFFALGAERTCSRGARRRFACHRKAAGMAVPNARIQAHSQADSARLTPMAITEMHQPATPRTTRAGIRKARFEVGFRTPGSRFVAMSGGALSLPPSSELPAECSSLLIFVSPRPRFRDPTASLSTPDRPIFHVNSNAGRGRRHHTAGRNPMLSENEDRACRSRTPLVPLYLVRTGLLSVLETHLEEDGSTTERPRDRVGMGLPVLSRPALRSRSETRSVDVAFVPKPSITAVPSPASLRTVARLAAGLERRGHPFVAEVHRHAFGGVVEVVAVVHPDAGVIGAEGDLVGLAWRDVEGVRPPRASADAYAVAREYEHVVAVEVHGVVHEAAVDEGRLYEVPLAHHLRGRVREHLAVDSPQHVEVPVVEAGAVVEDNLELPVEVA